MLSAASILVSSAFRVFHVWVTVRPRNGEGALISKVVEPGEVKIAKRTGCRDYRNPRPLSSS